MPEPKMTANGPTRKRKEAKNVHLYVEPAPGDGAGTQMTILITDEVGHRCHWQWIGTRAEIMEALSTLRQQADWYLRMNEPPREPGKHEGEWDING